MTCCTPDICHCCMGRRAWATCWYWAINSDASVTRLKGPERPLVPQAERAALLAALACVDAVTVFDEDTPLETIEAVRPHVLVKGADYKPEQVVGREVVEANGGRVALVPLMPQKSTLRAGGADQGAREGLASALGRSFPTREC